MIYPPCLYCMCVSIKYHDMNDVVDFLVLKHNYEASVQVTEDVKKVIFLMAGPLRPPPLVLNDSLNRATN